MTNSRKLIRSEPDCSESLDPFLWRLAETVAWCGARADESDPQGSLRSESVRPRTLEASYFDAVRAVGTWRHPRYRPDPPRPEPLLAGGRLLVYFPDADLCDGAAEVESGGFFDVFNCPPWDTWVAFAEDEGIDLNNSYRRYLVAWVPPVFLDACAGGIDVNPEECIRWPEDADVTLRHLIDQHAPELLWSG